MHIRGLCRGGTIESNQGSQRGHGHGRVEADAMVLAFSRFARYRYHVFKKKVVGKKLSTIRTVSTYVQDFYTILKVELALILLTLALFFCDRGNGYRCDQTC